MFVSMSHLKNAKLPYIMETSMTSPCYRHFLRNVKISSLNNVSYGIFVALFNLLDLLLDASILKAQALVSFVLATEILRSSVRGLPNSDHIILTSGYCLCILRADVILEDHISYHNRQLSDQRIQNSALSGWSCHNIFHNLVITQEPWNAELEFPYLVTFPELCQQISIAQYPVNNPHIGRQIIRHNWNILGSISPLLSR